MTLNKGTESGVRIQTVLQLYFPWNNVFLVLCHSFKKGAGSGVIMQTRWSQSGLIRVFVFDMTASPLSISVSQRTWLSPSGRFTFCSSEHIRYTSEWWDKTTSSNNKKESRFRAALVSLLYLMIWPVSDGGGSEQKVNQLWVLSVLSVPLMRHIKVFYVQHCALCEETFHWDKDASSLLGHKHRAPETFRLNDER